MNLQLSDNEKDVTKMKMVYITMLKQLVTIKFTSMLNAKAIKYGQELRNKLHNQQVNPFVQNAVVVG